MLSLLTKEKNEMQTTENHMGRQPTYLLSGRSFKRHALFLIATGEGGRAYLTTFLPKARKWSDSMA